jgi:hypothetical protein
MIALEHVARAMRLSLLIRTCSACTEAWRMLISSPVAMTWRHRAPKRQRATIRLSCSLYVFPQPAMRSPGGLSLHKEPCHGHSNVIPICTSPISNLRDLAPFRRAEDFTTFANGLLKAGLPE